MIEPIRIKLTKAGGDELLNKLDVARDEGDRNDAQQLWQERFAHLTEIAGTCEASGTGFVVTIAQHAAPSFCTEMGNAADIAGRHDARLAFELERRVNEVERHFELTRVDGCDFCCLGYHEQLDRLEVA